MAVALLLCEQAEMPITRMDAASIDFLEKMCFIMAEFWMSKDENRQLCRFKENKLRLFWGNLNKGIYTITLITRLARPKYEASDAYHGSALFYCYFPVARHSH